MSLPLLLLLTFLSPLIIAAEVSITSEGKILKGTLTNAAENKTRIAFILSGSGPTDRDGNTVGAFGKHNCLKLLSDALVKENISTLRVDKRGVAASAAAIAKENDLRFTTYVDDVSLWIKFLEQKGYQEIILIGHSEGALTATMAAAKHDKVTKLISLAGIGYSAPIILRKQLKAAYPDDLFQQADKVITSLSKGNEVKNPPQSLHLLFRPSVQPYLISWFSIDPAKELAKLKIPTLVIQGSTDLQTSPNDAKRLHKHVIKSQLKIIDEMNHVLKKAKGDQAAQIPSYIQPDMPLHPELAKVMVSFIK